MYCVFPCLAVLLGLSLGCFAKEDVNIQYNYVEVYSMYSRKYTLMHNAMATSRA